MKVRMRGKQNSQLEMISSKLSASFVIEFQERSSEDRAVEFRTAVHHMEADTSRDWPGIEREKHCQRMLEQSGNRISKQSSVEEKPAQGNTK